MNSRLLLVAAMMLAGTTSAIALVQKPESTLAETRAEALVLKLEATMPRASSFDRAP